MIDARHAHAAMVAALLPGKGIASQLLTLSCQYAKERGFEKMTGEVINPRNLAILQRHVTLQIHAKMPLNDFAYQGRKLFANVKDLHAIAFEFALTRK